MPGLVPQKADFVEDSVSSLPTMYTYILSTHIMLKVQSANPRPVICISNATSMKLVRGRHAAALPPPRTIYHEVVVTSTVLQSRKTLLISPQV